jgi:hypothetical protein
LEHVLLHKCKVPALVYNTCDIYRFPILNLYPNAKIFSVLSVDKRK